VGLLLFGGYWFGQLEFVKTHFGIVELAIIFISVLPMVIEFLRHRKKV
jgi:membrane-associated protein